MLAQVSIEVSSESSNVKQERIGMPKWPTAILSTIIGGVILWWLLESGVAPLKPGPDLKITDFRVPEPIYAGERVYAEISVYNEGGRTAEGCRLTWYPQSTLEWPNESEGTFGIPPKQSGKGKAWIVFKEAGDIMTTYGITGCDTGISPEDRSWFPTREVHVLPSR